MSGGSGQRRVGGGVWVGWGGGSLATRTTAFVLHSVGQGGVDKAAPTMPWRAQHACMAAAAPCAARSAVRPDDIAASLAPLFFTRSLMSKRLTVSRLRRTKVWSSASNTILPAAVLMEGAASVPEQATFRLAPNATSAFSMATRCVEPSVRPCVHSCLGHAWAGVGNARVAGWGQHSGVKARQRNATVDPSPQGSEGQSAPRRASPAQVHVGPGNTEPAPTAWRGRASTCTHECARAREERIAAPPALACSVNRSSTTHSAWNGAHWAVGVFCDAAPSAVNSVMQLFLAARAPAQARAPSVRKAASFMAIQVQGGGRRTLALAVHSAGWRTDVFHANENEAAGARSVDAPLLGSPTSRPKQRVGPEPGRGKTVVSMIVRTDAASKDVARGHRQNLA